MSKGEVLVAISSNNPEIESIFQTHIEHPEIKFVDKKHDHAPYQIFFIDLNKELNFISQNLIETYGKCRENDCKLVVVLLHTNQIDIEKNHYFQKMLEDLGKSNPLHRIVFTRDVYQGFTSKPATPLDEYLHIAITTEKINISRKGENLYFPVSFIDFNNALMKTLFLANTSGKSFWILGDAIHDLELSYLLKKYISGQNQNEPEINAIEDDNLKANSLLSAGNKSRGELNWNPESELVADLKNIVSLYSDNPTTPEIKHQKLNILHRLLLWIYKPKPKKESKLPTLGKIIKKIIISIVAIYFVLICVFVIATALALIKLETSMNQALKGNLQLSVESLNNSNKAKEIGDSVFVYLTPVSNIISSKYTEKIFNLYSFISYTSTSLGNLHQTYVMSENFLLSLNNPNANIKYGDLSLALHSNLSQIYENLNQISFLSSGGKLPEFIEKKIKNNPEFKNLDTLEEQIAQYIKVTDIIPAVFSEKGVKNLLILLQNSHSLQPSGGSVDYYLLLTLDQGNLISKKYYSGSEIDSLNQKNTVQPIKLKRFAVAPTTPILINEIVQNPDYAQLSNNLSQYIEKALKIKPDFVIATNNLLIEQLLLEENSTSVEQYKANYLEASGSSEYKKAFDQYLDRLFKHDLSLPVIGRSIAKTIGDNQVLIWSSDPNIERVISTQSYSGVLLTHPCSAGIDSTNACLSETTYLSESYTNPSRQYPWSNRTINHSINLNSSSIQHEYQLEYKAKNTDVESASISINYHIYLSSPSTLNKVLINDLPASTKDVTKIAEGTLDHYKIPLVLATNQDSLVSIKASTSSLSSLVTPFSYSITEYRQPGTVDPGINLKIFYPENLRPTIVTSPFVAEPSTMKISLPPHTSVFGFTLDQNRQ